MLAHRSGMLIVSELGPSAGSPMLSPKGTFVQVVTPAASVLSVPPASNLGTNPFSSVITFPTTETEILTLVSAFCAISLSWPGNIRKPKFIWRGNGDVFSMSSENDALDVSLSRRLVMPAATPMIALVST